MANEKTLDKSEGTKIEVTLKAQRKKPKSYLNVNDLEIPEEIEIAFRKQGYHLRFVRFIKPGTSNELDYQNLGKRIQQGYTFVSSREAPELALTSFKRDIDIVGFDGGDFKDVIVKGDVALMKVPLENVLERQKEVATVVRNQMMAVNTQAKRSNLIDESRTETKTYKQRRGESREVGFAED